MLDQFTVIKDDDDVVVVFWTISTVDWHRLFDVEVELKTNFTPANNSIKKLSPFRNFFERVSLPDTYLLPDNTGVLYSTVQHDS